MGKSHISDIKVDNLVKLASRMSLHEDEEYHMTNHPMVEIPLESDQTGFEAAVGKDGNEMENGDTQNIVRSSEKKKEVDRKGS